MSEQIRMPKSDWTNLLDTVRAKTGSKELMVSSQVPAAVEEVYAAGRRTEYDAFWDSCQQNGKRADYEGAFSGQGWTNEIFRLKYDIQPTSAYMLFRKTFIKDLSDAKFAEMGKRIDFSKCNNFQYFATLSRARHFGTIDMTGLAGRSAGYCTQAFANSDALHTIDKIISNEDVKFSNDMFSGCTALENITFEGTIASDINFSACPLSADSMKSILDHLEDYRGPKGTMLPDAYTKTITVNDDSIKAYNEKYATYYPGHDVWGDTWDQLLDKIGWLY